MIYTIQNVRDAVLTNFDGIKTKEVGVAGYGSTLFHQGATSTISVINGEQVVIGKIVIQHNTGRHRGMLPAMFNDPSARTNSPVHCSKVTASMQAIATADRLYGKPNQHIIQALSNTLETFVAMNATFTDVEQYNEITLTRSAISLSIPGNIEVYISFDLDAVKLEGLKDSIGEYVISRGMVRLLNAPVAGMIEPMETWVTFKDPDGPGELHLTLIRYTLSEGEKALYKNSRKFLWHEAACMAGDTGDKFDVFPAIISIIRSSTESEYAMAPVAASIKYRGEEQCSSMEVVTPTEKWSFSVTKR